MASKKVTMKIDWKFKELDGYPSHQGFANIIVTTPDGVTFNKEISQKGTSNVDCARTLARSSHFTELIKTFTVMAVDDVPEDLIDKPKTRKKSNAKNNRSK